MKQSKFWIIYTFFRKCFHRLFSITRSFLLLRREMDPVSIENDYCVFEVMGGGRPSERESG